MERSKTAIITLEEARGRFEGLTECGVTEFGPFHVHRATAISLAEFPFGRAGTNLFNPGCNRAARPL